jgi:hypothetical protein
MESILLATAQTPATPKPSRSANVALALVATVAVSALLLTGVTFFGLAVGFSIALPVAEQFHVPVKPSDLEIIRQFAPLWWVFALATVASVAGALFVAVKALGRVSPVLPE